MTIHNRHLERSIEEQKSCLLQGQSCLVALFYSGFFFVGAFFELHRLPAAGDVAYARLVTIFDNFKLDAARIAA
jgi:hypothetical protein